MVGDSSGDSIVDSVCVDDSDMDATDVDVKSMFCNSLFSKSGSDLYKMLPIGARAMC